MKADDIRARFIGFFERHGHLHVPSSSLVPEDDPTLMFTNAGMVQFKRIFQGEQEPPGPRAVTSQKCLRVSGKHNDLEEVGRTARHHTFFEMLGNFSFGDYFKRDAIRFAWEFVTDDLGLDPERIWATVHHTDDEAYGLWTELTPLPPSRVRRLGDRDNFWQMGDTGPCGPCSELHYDRRAEPDDRITDEQFELAGEADEFMELWNLVFMQFDRAPDGTDTPLPAPSIDTGAGLERIAAILQGVGTNYHTDLFMPLIEAAQEPLGRDYSTSPEDWEEGLPFRVVADHARAVAFLLADGVFPSNEKRGYVLRRILRRAVRHYWLLGRREPMLDGLVGVVVDRMSHVYPQLETRREHLLATTRAEEERFLATIEGGMTRFDEIAPPDGVGTIAGEDVFKLYDTYGFPLDLTELMAAERGYGVDTAGFDVALERQRERSRASVAAEGGGESGHVGERLSAHDAEQLFVGYDRLTAETSVLASVDEGGEAAVILRENPFYVESGGQVSDRGSVEGDGWSIDVTRVHRNDLGQTVVAGSLAGRLDPSDVVYAAVNADARRETERNHSATHLLHAALRERLGDHVQQAGSLVAPDRLRFDFSHRGPLTPEERTEIEARVNEWILANEDVTPRQRDYREALAAGAMALFGEKYGDVVRVVEVPGVSLELCGGTHVRTTGQIGLFRIVSETGVAAGIRRIEALSGRGAYEWTRTRDGILQSLADRLRVPANEIPGRIERLLVERDRLEREAEDLRGDEAADQVEKLLAAGGGDGARFMSGRVELPSGTDLGELGDRLRERIGSGAVLLHVVFPGEERQAFVSVVSDDLIQGGLRAGDLVRVSSKATGSGGGGRPHFAQGGVGDPDKVDDAFGAARDWATERLPDLAG
ncbi:MAG: alanine--tRNA ligase [Gemmatimonadota bacterium]|nr:alanine--tRNA ligase [Gemmatimonadota bacterium]